MPTVTESEQLERIQQLSSHLAESKHRETELTTTMRALREQIKDLETVSNSAYNRPGNSSSQRITNRATVSSCHPSQ